MKRYLILSIPLLLTGVFVFLPAQAQFTVGFVEPVDVFRSPLRDGDLIGAFGSDDPDIYIVNILGFAQRDDAGDFRSYNGSKRLFLNPTIFNFYGHLGGFANVRRVTPEVRDSFLTSGLFRNCETDDERVWAVEVTGEDSGVFHHVQISGDAAVLEDPHFFKKVFCINSNEERWYAKSIFPYTRLADVPRYQRSFGSPTVRVTAPNGGETFLGTSFTASWDADFINQNHEFFISLISEDGIGGVTSVMRLPYNRRFVQIPIPGLGDTNAEGRYRIRVAVHRDSPDSGPAGPEVVRDESDGLFTIANQQCVPLPPCALPGAIPACAIDLAPGSYACKLPLTHFLTVDVQNTSDDFVVTLNGQLDSVCQKLIPISIDVTSNIINVHQQVDPGDPNLSCVLALIPFTRTVSLGDLLTRGEDYELFVNGTLHWAGQRSQ